MKRRVFLLFTATAIMVVVATLGMQKKPKPTLLLLEWAAKGDKTAPPTAILIEMGLKDERPVDWSGRVKVTGAKVVHREGYRFRKGDELTDPDGWKASSHRGLRVPRNNPLAVRMEGIATVGVVLHLTDVDRLATLTIEVPPGIARRPAEMRVQDVLSGKPVSLWGGAARVRLVTTATRLTDGKTEDDFPAACYGPDGTLWVAYIAYTLKEEGRRIEAESLKEQPADFKQFYTPEFGDQLFVRYYRSGKWSKPFAVTGTKEDLFRCAIAAEKNGDVWVVYSANRTGNYDLYARKLDLKTAEAVSHPKPNIGPEQRLTDSRAPDLNPALCTLYDGRLLLAYQSWEFKRSSHISIMSYEQGKWSDEIRTARDGKLQRKQFGLSAWHPAVASGPGERFAAVYDDYGGSGDYGVSLALEDTPAGLHLNWGIMSTAPFEARPSICYDTRGRLWIAYEEGPEKWGKDYGSLVIGKGHPLYDQRSIRVVCLEDHDQKRPVAELPTSTVEAPVAGDALKTQQFEKGKRYAYPQIGIDGKGRIWLTYREKFGSRYTTHPGSYWLTFARRLDGDKWSEPIEVHHSDGLLDHRPVLLPHAAGGLLIVHNTDGRYTTPETVQNRIYTSYIDLPGDPIEPKLVDRPCKGDESLHKEAEKEREAVKRMRDYRVESEGKKYQLLRGEFHRHTEMSWDGGADGSLEDMFRYAIDAAELDWIGNGDHDNGAGREYSWWLTQKFSDAYHVPGRFTPMFSYERSVAYPHGHRNCLFAKRGVRTLPRLAQPDEKKRVGGVHADDTKMLYRYLKELDGICAVHTSATSMGTDWRDNDPDVEPVVEIYQGDRMSYEQQGAPRAGYEAKSGKKPINIAGWYPDGFVDRALAKGYKLGFQASSDHWSTHISYFVVLAEKNDRESLLDAIKKRHCYGATDNIVLDVRCGDHLMGDAFDARKAPVLHLHVVGTGKLAAIDILADSKVVHTIKPDGSDYKGEWTAPKAKAGKHYYYVRVRQADGELAWSSPLWVELKP